MHYIHCVQTQNTLPSIAFSTRDGCIRARNIALALKRRIFVMLECQGRVEGSDPKKTQARINLPHTPREQVSLYANVIDQDLGPWFFFPSLRSEIFFSHSLRRQMGPNCNSAIEINSLHYKTPSLNDSQNTLPFLRIECQRFNFTSDLSWHFILSVPFFS